MRIERTLRLLAALACLLPAAAGELEWAGYVKSLLSVSDARDSYQALGLTDEDASADWFTRMRLELEQGFDRGLEAQVHSETRALWGNSVEAQQVQPAAPRVSFLDLETVLEEDEWRFTQNLDRLNLRWRGEAHQVSIGRQPVTWGSALLWTPTDLFAGFSPTELDRDEKPGVDVVRWTWNPDFESSLDLVAEPLSAEGPGHATVDDSSLALRAFTRLGETDVAMLGGQVAGDRVLGADFAGYLRDAGFRGEILHTWVDEPGERDYLRAVIGMDYAWSLPRDPYLAVEYFYNGLGAGDEDGYLARVQAESVQRAFGRGNAFNVGRHYLGATLRLSLSALVGVSATTLANLEDGSLREFAVISWNARQDLDLQFGVNLGLGGEGSEFEGFTPGPDGSPVENPDAAFTYLKFYF